MASAFAHAVVAGAGYAAVRQDYMKGSVLALGIFCAVMPDLDVIAFAFGIPYEHMLGHRGATHSILFGIFWGLLMAVIFHRSLKPDQRKMVALFYICCTISHGIIDAFTTGGRGIGFLIPFTDERFFAPWRYIRVSSIHWERFFSSHGLRVLQNELWTVMIPAVSIALIVIVLRKLLRSTRS